MKSVMVEVVMAVCLHPSVSAGECHHHRRGHPLCACHSVYQMTVALR
jgi:hypothetical protein